jgi:hypothetical protein
MIEYDFMKVIWKKFKPKILNFEFQDIEFWVIFII